MKNIKVIPGVTLLDRHFIVATLVSITILLLLAGRSVQADAPDGHVVDAIAGVDVNPTHIDVVEGGVAGSYAVVLTDRPTAPVTITLEAKVEAKEQVALSTSELVFDETNWSIRQVVIVSAVDDQEFEDPLHVGVIAHSVSSADPDYDGLNTLDVIVVIGDNDGNRVYLPLLGRNILPPAPSHKLDDAPDVCPGYMAQVGHAYRDNWDWENDADWYAFVASAGMTYTIQTGNLAGDTDTVLALYAKDCTTQLAKNDDDDAAQNSLASRIEWQAPDKGVYCVLARAYDWRVYGEDTGYTLEIRELGK